MRVLNLVPSSGSVFYKQQIKGLSALGVEQTTLTVPGDRDYQDGETNSRSLTDYLQFVLPVAIHSFRDYDLIHANFGLTAPPAILQPTLPTIISLWGSDLMGEYSWVSQLSARYADDVVVMSNEMAAALNRDCHVIPHGVDLDKFRPRSPGVARRELDWSEDTYHVLFPYPPARDIKDYPRAKRITEAAEKRVDQPIELHTISGISHERMSLYMNGTDALVLTSRREGSPNSVKEALACNTPIVSTNVGDVEERLEGVTPSVVAQSDENLITGLVDILRSGNRSNGRDAAREISVEHSSKQLFEIYRRVLDGR